MSFHTFLGEFSVLFLKKNFFWSHYLHIFFLIHYLYFHIDLYYCKLIWFLCIFWMLRWWNVLQIYFSNLRFVVLWYFLLYRSVFLKIIVKFTAFVISTFFLFLFQGDNNILYFLLKHLNLCFSDLGFQSTWNLFFVRCDVREHVLARGF